MDYEGNTLAEQNIKGVVILPDTINSIAEQVFSGCSIKEVFIPEGVTSIKAGAFMACSELTRISLPESLKIIGEEAFGGCEAASIKVPDGIDQIGASAFYNVENIEYHGSAKYNKEDKYWGAKTMNKTNS